MCCFTESASASETDGTGVSTSENNPPNQPCQIVSKDDGRYFRFNVVVVHHLCWNILKLSLSIGPPKCEATFCQIRCLCRLQSIAACRDHFVRRLSLLHPSVCPSIRVSVRLSGSHTFLLVTHSYISQVTDAFLGMLPLFALIKVLQTIAKLQSICHSSSVFFGTIKYPL